ncbi:hypothetical protein BN159_0314 [Streptomyces davaonensis JCM 4913]|uniref:Uncharacterized protein n=1 Tax=Streptomyces davaonensis (strain DSM 101723 / JCM 4913 / KCC S-0913 / 768) TaxID=1214101 RepID=K4QUN9_STRDJ|nr:hypothetical protein [Streptomyces davaonensis]CCK24693.1 hypothetical protein BN159_0314 [Streptomyces davaonensis JCM 4913]
MSWSFIVQITDCASGRPVDGATVHVKGYYEYEDQVPAESWTAIADGQGRLAIEAMDSVIVVDALVGKPGYVAGLLRFEPDAAGTIVQGCLQPAAASSGTRRPEALRVTGWGEAHVDIEWWNPEPYQDILVGWSDATVSPGVHNQQELPGSATAARLSIPLAQEHAYDLKVEGYGSAHGWSGWTQIVWTRPADGPIPVDAESQPLWRWCEKCKGLIYADAAATSMSVGVVTGFNRDCNAGGVHRVTHSGKYEPFHGPQAPSLVGRTQVGWRWCRACSALFYIGYGSGACNDGGGHDAVESGDYYLYYERNPPGTQANWRWCNRCQSLAFDDGVPGVCFDRGAHDYGGSGNYAVVHLP